LTLSCEIRSDDFVEDIRDRRQVTRDAGIRDPKGTQSAGGGHSIEARPSFVSLQRLEAKVPDTSRAWLARRYGVSRSCIDRIVLEQTWRAAL